VLSLPPAFVLSQDQTLKLSLKTLFECNVFYLASVLLLIVLADVKVHLKIWRANSLFELAFKQTCIHRFQKKMLQTTDTGLPVLFFIWLKKSFSGFICRFHSIQDASASQDNRRLRIPSLVPDSQCQRAQSQNWQQEDNEAFSAWWRFKKSPLFLLNNNP
jgi:hypothetical protein